LIFDLEIGTYKNKENQSHSPQTDTHPFGCRLAKLEQIRCAEIQEALACLRKSVFTKYRLTVYRVFGIVAISG
jgi:hypothetical protein